MKAKTANSQQKQFSMNLSLAGCRLLLEEFYLMISVGNKFEMIGQLLQ